MLSERVAGAPLLPAQGDPLNATEPSFKLAANPRDGARFGRRYHAPATPHARLLATGEVEPGVEGRLAAEFAALDPVALLAAIRGSQERLAALAGRGGDAPPPAPRRRGPLPAWLGPASPGAGGPGPPPSAAD